MDPSTEADEPEDRADEPAAGTVVRPPAEGTVVRPSAEGTVVRPPAEGTVVRPPADGTVVRPPADGTVVPPPTPAGREDRAAVRFGPGPPTPGSPTPPAPGWAAAGPVKRATGGRGRKIGAGALVTALVVAGVLLYLSHRPSVPLQVTSASVAPAVDPGRSCDTEVDVVGTVHTNGSPGQITYRWVRSDGNQTDTLNQTVGGGATTVQVHLQWKVTGKGRYPATATLQVARPNPVEAKGGFVYDCR